MEQKTTAVEASVVRGGANRDPLSGEAGAHPVGTGTGAAGGGIAGAMIGAAAAGPIGAGVGAVVGAVAGGLAGKGAAEALNPTVEHEYWRVEFQNRPYFTNGTPYDQYGPAYQYGWQSYAKYKNVKFADVEPELGRGWESQRGSSKLSWRHAQNATRDAWQRAEAAVCANVCR